MGSGSISGDHVQAAGCPMKFEPDPISGSGIARDPAVTFSALALWGLLAIFVVYPLAMLLARIVVDHGALTSDALAKVLSDRHQIRAFWNSLLLASVVGV